MPKKFIKRHLPDYKTIKEHKNLKIFGNLLHDPNLWHLNRKSVSGAVAVGLFVAFMPIPFQMVAAVAIAIASRVNLPISAVLVWITNPLTMAPIFYFAYVCGAWLLDTPTHHIEFNLSIEWFNTQLLQIWQPFLLGCLLLSTCSAITGRIIVNQFWRSHVLNNWKQRRENRKNGKRK